MPSRHSAKSDNSDNLDQEAKWDHSQRSLRAWLIALHRELPNDSALHKSYVATRSVSSKAHTIVINKQHAVDLKCMSGSGVSEADVELGEARAAHATVDGQ